MKCAPKARGSLDARFHRYRRKASAVHSVFGKILIELLAVILLFLLNMGKRVTQGGTAEFENAYIINGRNMLFHGKRILAKKCVLVLFALRAGGKRRIEALALCRGSGHGLHLLAPKNAIDRSEVALLRGFQRGKEILQCGIACLLVSGRVLFDSELLAAFQII